MLDKLQNQLKELNTFNSSFDLLDEEVSKASVGWHSEHILLVIGSIIKALEQSNPKDYKWKFNLARLVVMTVKNIPRGRGKSPKMVLPKEGVNQESVKEHLNLVLHRTEALKTMDSNQFFKHPYFGLLNLKNTIKFLEIHTEHHLAIIRDIIKISNK